jgi:putative transcriptional regulator
MTNKTTIVRVGAKGEVIKIHPNGSEEILKVERSRERPDEQIEAAALSDPENPPLTPAQRARLHRVPRVRTLRWEMGLSQAQFASRFQIPLGTLRDWEQGRTEPDQAARAYLDVIAHDPENVRKALLAAKKPRRSRSKIASS